MPDGKVPAVGVERPAEPAECLLDSTPGSVARRLASLDWDFADAPAGSATHSLHPYPAKFIPQVAHQAITLLSRRGDLILDPFSGGGTSAVEAVAASRRFVGIDANPVGNAIALAKTRRLHRKDVKALQQLEATLLSLQRSELLAATPAWLPRIPHVEKWYDGDIFRALGLIREHVDDIGPGHARGLALVAFIQAAARLSFQESETRYASRPRPMDILEAPRAVLGELRRMRRIAAQAPEAAPEDLRILDGDSRDPASFEIEPESVGLVVTSPPYPNAYDYHLYHRFRLFWLGCDPAELRSVEIGSHLKNQAVKSPTDAYLADMRAVLENSYAGLGAGRYAVIVVGDGMFHGEIFETARHICRVATELGYDHVTSLDRTLPLHRRSVTRPGRRLTCEQIVFLRRPVAARSASVVAPNYNLFPYERDLQLRELRALGASPFVCADGAIDVVAVPDIDRAAFCHGFERHTGHVVVTRQCLAEGAPSPGSRRKSSSRKNSTYFAHGIHRYKGKFYPQLAKSLLNISGLYPAESLVVDPFGGSGTVALEAMLNGFNALSIDCNPVATSIARAKLSLARLPADRCVPALRRMAKRVSKAPPSGERDLEQFAPDTLPELERWFPAPVLSKLDWLLDTIRQADSDLVDVLEVLVSDIIRDISQQEPRDLRIRRRAVPIDDAPVYALFLARLDQTIRRVSAFWKHMQASTGGSGQGEVALASSAEWATFEELLRGRQVDAVVSSPPYASALPYVDTDRLSLAAVFGLPPTERRSLERSIIGSREITERQRAAFETELDNEIDSVLPESTRRFLVDYRTAVAADASAGFRRRQTPAVLLRYFRSMSGVLANLKRSMAAGAPCWLVLGDSRSTVGGHRWVIPTVSEIAAIAELHGFRVVERLPITVTREDVLHSRHAITRNEIVELRA